MDVTKANLGLNRPSLLLWLFLFFVFKIVILIIFFKLQIHFLPTITKEIIMFIYFIISIYAIICVRYFNVFISNLHNWTHDCIERFSKIWNRQCCFNSLLLNGTFLYPLKTENFWFSDLFRGYRDGTLTWNELKQMILVTSMSTLTFFLWH